MPRPACFLFRCLTLCLGLPASSSAVEHCPCWSSYLRRMAFPHPSSTACSRSPMKLAVCSTPESPSPLSPVRAVVRILELLRGIQPSDFTSRVCLSYPLDVGCRKRGRDTERPGMEGTRTSFCSRLLPTLRQTGCGCGCSVLLCAVCTQERAATPGLRSSSEEPALCLTAMRRCHVGHTGNSPCAGAPFGLLVLAAGCPRPTKLWKITRGSPRE